MTAVEIGKVYSSNAYGDFVVLDKDTAINGNYIIKFLSTGYTTSVRGDRISTGGIRDPFYPSVSNVGYVGNINFNATTHPLYKTWNGMIRRCYNPKDHAYNLYGGAGVTVCTRWHCFENFIQDAVNLPGYNDMINNPHIYYNLDKDILQKDKPKNEKIYSPETCMWIPAIYNTAEMHADTVSTRHRSSTSYANVYLTDKGTYSVVIGHLNEQRRIGRYADPIVAANAANHARRIFGMPIINTNVPYISQEEVNAQNRATKRNKMFDIIDNGQFND